jgi:hypothetical protein
MTQKRFIIEVEKAKEATEDRPSRGPAYRSIFAKDGFPAPIQGLDSCWDVFRLVYHSLLISMLRNILNLFHVDFILTLVEPSFSSNNHHIIVFIRTLY